jgi:hypothetical protein
MKRYLILLALFFSINSAFAEKVTITPLEEINTSKKVFQVGNTYKFKSVNNEKIYTGNVIFYRPNGFLGQEAQIEIANFMDEKGQYLPGKITIIPDNHKNFQEFMNYFSLSAFAFVRGSEIILKPDVHKFQLSEKDMNNELIIPIQPVEEISTSNDELEFGDIVEFKIIRNVYKKGTLYIKSETPIYGIIDSIDENGWCADNAAIYFKEFKTKDVNNNKITIKADLKIDGFEILKFKSVRQKQFFNYFSTFIRGKEVDIKDSDRDIKFVLITK